jgi:hypothetical protein
MKKNIDGLPVDWMECTDDADEEILSYGGGEVATDLLSSKTSDWAAIMEGE